jgi:hypothetical protein
MSRQHAHLAVTVGPSAVSPLRAALADAFEAWLWIRGGDDLDSIVAEFLGEHPTWRLDDLLAVIDDLAHDERIALEATSDGEIMLRPLAEVLDGEPDALAA